MSADPERKPDHLDAAYRELMAKSDAADAAHEALNERLLQSLARCLARATKVDAEKITGPIAAQLQMLEARLRALSVLGDTPGSSVSADIGGGRVVVGVDVGGARYAFARPAVIGAGLVVLQTVEGGYWFAELGDDGEAIEWVRDVSGDDPPTDTPGLN